MSRSEYWDAAEITKALARRENNKRRRILVVEDDQISLALLKQLLEVHGYEILETPKGLEAIDIARNEITLGNLLRTIASFLSSVPSAVGSRQVSNVQ